VNEEKPLSESLPEFFEHFVQRSCGLGGRWIATETAEAAGGRTGGGGTLNSPFMTALLAAGLSLNETDRKSMEDLLPPGGFDPEENFRVPFGGFPVAFGGDGGTGSGSGAGAVDVEDDIFHFLGSVDEM